MVTRFERHIGSRDELAPGRFFTDVTRHDAARACIVYLACPKCGGVDALSPEHVIEKSTGQVVPAWKCPTATCDWWELVELVGYGAPA